MPAPDLGRSDVAEPREGHPGPRPVTGLTVFYDRRCELCRRSRAWLETEPQRVPLRFLATDGPEARQLAPELPWLGAELVVVADDGAVWIGPAAFLVCLWATERHHRWAHRLSSPTLAPLAERFLTSVSANRRRISAGLHRQTCRDGSCSTGGHVGSQPSSPGLR